jgi:hypothetical protein
MIFGCEFIRVIRKKNKVKKPRFGSVDIVNFMLEIPIQSRAHLRLMTNRNI